MIMIMIFCRLLDWMEDEIAGGGFIVGNCPYLYGVHERYRQLTINSEGF